MFMSVRVSADFPVVSMRVIMLCVDGVNVVMNVLAPGHERLRRTIFTAATADGK